MARSDPRLTDSASDADEHPLDSIAEDFATRRRRGEPVTVDKYLEQYPQWATQLRELLSSIALMEKLKAHGSSASRGDGTVIPPPQVLGDFRIIREVGRGGMGVVYEAFEQSLGRHVAVKILSAAAMIDPRRLQRFEREAQAAGRLHHTNIVPVFGAGRVDAIHFYVMQFIEGEALNELLARTSTEKVHPALCAPATNGLLTSSACDPIQGTAVSRRALHHSPRGAKYWRWAADVGRQVAGALDYAHQQGTLHRDIKPANLLIDARGTIWITDFGLAKLAGPRDVTQSGDVIGTLQYLAPESLQGKADARSDIYSLGLTLYELLTLTAPIQGDTPAATLRAIAEMTPTPPRRLVAAIPQDLETIVLKALSRDPGARYQTAAAMAEDLDNFLHDRPIAARRISIPERLWRWCRRNRALASASGLAASAAIVAIIVACVGYVKTRDALAAEAARRVEADRATARAEQNMQLSLHAFEDIFNQVDKQQTVAMNPERPDDAGNGPPRDRGPGPDGNGDGPRNPGSGSAPGRSGDANILRSILGFYDKFAHDNATNPLLDAEAARAYQRIGDLYFRMGNESQAAQQAYTRAAAMYEHLKAGGDKTDLQTLIGFADALTSRAPELSTSSAPTQATDMTAVTESLNDQKVQLERVIEDLTSVSPSSYVVSQRKASALSRLGDVQLAMKEKTAAVESYRAAMALWRSIPPMPPPGPPIATPQAPDTAFALAKQLIDEDRLSEARDVLLFASHLDHSQRPNVPPDQREKVARLDDMLSAIDRRLSDPREAEMASREATRLRSRQRGPDDDRRPGEGPRPDRPGSEPPPPLDRPQPPEPNRNSEQDRPPPPAGPRQGERR